MTATSDTALVSRFRRGQLVLAGAAAVGTAVELAMLRHWNGVEQLVPWATLTLVIVGIVVVGAGRGRAAIVSGRVIGIATGLASLFGVYDHITSNYEAGPLDFRYTDRWPTMSEWSRWWAAASGAVGPSPALAPAVLALAGSCLALATLGRTVHHSDPNHHEPEMPAVGSSSRTEDRPATARPGTA